VSIFEKLKTLFEAKIEGDFFSNNTFKLFDFSKNVSSPLEAKETSEGTKLSIDVSKATENEKKVLKEIIDEKIQEEDETFLTKGSNDKTKQIKRNLLNTADDVVLSFYKDKIPYDMYKALEISLIVRNAFRNGEDIIELKRDIAWKFPKFGNNICNLTTSDYFHEYFQELYEAMKQDPNFTLKDYNQEVERIVIELPYMVFINRHKSLEEFAGQVKFKIDKLKRYGASKLKLHALGKDNVERAEKIAYLYREDKDISVDKKIDSNRTVVTIIFNF